MISFLAEIEFRGRWLDLKVFGYVNTTGGGYYEPIVIESEIDEIRSSNGKKISDRLQNALINKFDDYFHERFCEA